MDGAAGDLALPQLRHSFILSATPKVKTSEVPLGLDFKLDLLPPPAISLLTISRRLCPNPSRWGVPAVVAVNAEKFLVLTHHPGGDSLLLLCDARAGKAVPLPPAPLWFGCPDTHKVFGITSETSDTGIHHFVTMVRSPGPKRVPPNVLCQPHLMTYSTETKCWVESKLDLNFWELQGLVPATSYGSKLWSTSAYPLHCGRLRGFLPLNKLVHPLSIMVEVTTLPAYPSRQPFLVGGTRVDTIGNVYYGSESDDDIYIHDYTHYADEGYDYRYDYPDENYDYTYDNAYLQTIKTKAYCSQHPFIGVSDGKLHHVHVDLQPGEESVLVYAVSADGELAWLQEEKAPLSDVFRGNAGKRILASIVSKRRDLSPVSIDVDNPKIVYFCYRNWIMTVDVHEKKLLKMSAFENSATHPELNVRFLTWAVPADVYLKGSSHKEDQDEYELCKKNGWKRPEPLILKSVSPVKECTFATPGGGELRLKVKRKPNGKPYREERRS